jgi:ribosomal-protein-alanine N-acetyltransferase
MKWSTTQVSIYWFVPLSHEYLEIMDGWTYGEYFPDFDVDAYHASARLGASRLTGPGGCDGFAVLNVDGELTGLFEYYFTNDGTASIGLALAPSLTNRGIGRGFLEAGMEFLMSNYDYDGAYVYLDVDPGNDPALKLYERAGFELVSTDAGSGELQMRRRITSP